ncbi:MAG: twin-arginine translocation pathway signal, partial [Bacteroidota bacterium]
KQNASNGTDHGTANNLFLMGGNLRKPGIYNAAPNLTDLDKGDLKFKLDFRRVYAVVLDGWLSAPSEKIMGNRFKKLGIV